MTGTDELVRISWTKLRNWDECPAKADLMRAHKSPVSDIRNYFPGTVADRLMDAWLGMGDNEHPPPAGWMAANVDAYMESEEITARETGDGLVRWKTPGDKAEVREFVHETVVRLEEILGEYCLPFDWAQHWRFKVPISIDGTDVLLIGETDLLVFEPWDAGRIMIWDLKATKNNAYYEKVLGQIAFYWIAIAASHGTVFGKPPGRVHRLGRFPAGGGLIQPMCDQRVLPVGVGDQAIREIIGRIERVTRDIRAGRTDPKPGSYCGRCEVRHACPVFKIEGGRGRVRIAVLPARHVVQRAPRVLLQLRSRPGHPARGGLPAARARVPGAQVRCPVLPAGRGRDGGLPGRLL